MTSQLPPKRRDTKDRADLIRHLRTNAGQLGVGFMGGRFPPLRPLGSSALIGDIEDDTAIAEPMWEYDDRLVVSASGEQVFFLSHVPIEESLVVRWHPDGGAPLTQTNERWTLADNVVTIPDPDSDFAAGDVFSAQYQYDPNIEQVDGPVTVIGTGTLFDDDPVVPIPAEARSGDYLIVLTQGENVFLDGGTISDGRMGLLGSYAMVFGQMSRAYGGRLSTLGDVAISGSDVEVTWAVLRAPQVTVTGTPVHGPGAGPDALARVSARHAVFLGFCYQNVTAATLDTPTSYTHVVTGGQTHYKQKIAVWDDDAQAGISPVANISGSFDDYYGLVIGVTNTDPDTEDGE